MIKYNNKTINDWYFDNKNVIKVYKNNAVCYYKIVSGGGTPYDEQYLTIESLEDNNTIYLKASSDGIAKTVSASTDNGATWTEYTSSSADDNGTALATLNTGEKLLVKGENSTYATTTSNYNQFASTGQFEAKGNIMSLIYGDNFENQTELTGAYNFCSLFRNPNVVSAENLILPATTLSEHCYQYMFVGCTNLTTAPELPATTLASYCYGNMFRNCTSLNYIKCLATDISASNCTYGWVNGVAASGTFVKNAAMTGWTMGKNGIPTGWTVQDDDGGIQGGGDIDPGYGGDPDGGEGE